MDLDTEIKMLKGIGETKTKQMEKLGIRTIRDLISHFPRAYEDRTAEKKIEDLTIGESVCVRAMAADSPRFTHIRKGLDLIKLRAVDDTGSLELVFFNQTFVADILIRGETYIFYGKISGTSQKPEMKGAIFEHETAHGRTTGRLVPIYPLTAGISQNLLARAIQSALTECADTLPEIIPDATAREYELCKARFAYENIHFPADEKSLDIARKRLIFEEFFTLSAAMKILRAGQAGKNGRILQKPDFTEFYSLLPFIPTNAQKRAVEDALQDMSTGKPMNRLVQGDVGSGKTLVAAACCWAAWKSGCQSAFMVPTEILATQHFRSLSGMLSPLGVRVGLLTGSMKAKEKRDIRQKLALGEIDVITGTHALISGSVEFKNLVLVITDEQHRFGVSQRALLTEKGQTPHVMVMSATPIPRTLALIVYGDLDVTVINEMPPGRQEIDTFVVVENHRKRINGFIEKLVNEGRQVYVICPMVEESENADEGLKAARIYAETLQKDVFPHLNVKLCHGKLPAREKEAAMNAFSAGEAHILVATTVIEVGVDVPNAALIVIENAERFGLSQLHQLRGRVGRGKHKSYCVLFHGGGGLVSKERLDVMKSTNDGFKIAEEDLNLRGPGDFFGHRQHGLPEMKIASFARDMELLQNAQKAASDVLSADPYLSSPPNKPLATQLSRLFEITSERLN